MSRDFLCIASFSSLLYYYDSSPSHRYIFYCFIISSCRWGGKETSCAKVMHKFFERAQLIPFFFQIKISNVLGNKKKDERAVNSEIHHHHQRIGNIRWPAAEILFWFFSFGILLKVVQQQNRKLKNPFLKEESENKKGKKSWSPLESAISFTLWAFFYVLWNKIKEKREKKNRRGAIYHKGRMSRKETRKDLFVCILFSLPTDSFIPSLAWSVGCGAADGEWELVTRLVGSRCEWMQIKREATSSNGHILLATVHRRERESKKRSAIKEPWQRERSSSLL